jgi:hypothetical protein
MGHIPQCLLEPTQYRRIVIHDQNASFYLLRHNRTEILIRAYDIGQFLVELKVAARKKSS